MLNTHNILGDCSSNGVETDGKPDQPCSLVHDTTLNAWMLSETKKGPVVDKRPLYPQSGASCVGSSIEGATRAKSVDDNQIQSELLNVCNYSYIYFL